MKHTRLLSLIAVALAFGGCTAVTVRPEGELPQPLVVAIPTKVGVVVTPEARNYTHKETRAGINFEAQLGDSHQRIVEEIFKAEFREAVIFQSLDEARTAPGLLAIFEPKINQFSFATAKETGGQYCAVTIAYQIGIYTPTGELVDTLSLTGYGSGPVPKIGNGEVELAIAGYAAMRDAAAKFLTQFPGLDVAKPLLASQALAPKVAPVAGSPEAAAESAAAINDAIEAVPINDAPPVEPAEPAEATSPAGS